MSKFLIHPKAIVESNSIGEKTRIWAFAHVLPGAVIGSDCNICDHTFIENEVLIGDRVTIKSGVQLWDGIILQDDVFIGPNATFTNDLFPRSKQYLDEYSKTIVHKGASIGANATILPGINIGQYAMVGAGSVVTKDVPPYAIVMGNPARITGYMQSLNQDSPRASTRVSRNETSLISQVGAFIYELPLVEDLRGKLSYAQYGDSLPFNPKRYFLVFDVPSKEIRGEHAHRKCHQFLVCVKGSCSVVVDNGRNRSEICLDHPSLGLHIPPMIWATQYKYSPDAVLMVFASDIYDPDDYIRDYDNYLEEINKHGN